jgi:hypothetical protein
VLGRLTLGSVFCDERRHPSYAIGGEGWINCADIVTRKGPLATPRQTKFVDLSPAPATNVLAQG